MRARTGEGSARACALLAGVAIAAALGCTATQSREHTREAYLAPSEPAAAVSRIFPFAAPLVYDVLLDWLLLRSVEIEDANPAAGTIAADLRFGSDEAQDAAVRMGSVRSVLTRTKRRYRTYWPFEAHCAPCIIRRGNIVSAETELVRDRTVELAARDYEIAALLRAFVSEVPDGTSVELSVDFLVRPEAPPGIAPASTGVLEEAVFEALEQGLYDE